ncbi:MAG: hypothetical protein AAF901_01285 [Bacteroidota bacterium]
MKNNTLTALVVFFMTVACLIILDDMANTDTNNQPKYQEADIHTQQDQDANLAIIEENE